MHAHNFFRSLLVLALIPVAAAEPAPEGCAETLAGLRRLDDNLHHTWRETSMSDGKPMILSISEDKGALHIEFQKTGEGRWATGLAKFCRRGTALEVRMSAVNLGPAAPWLMRHTLGNGPLFLLRRQGAGELHVSTTGWVGAFMPTQP